jgi:hypothetical protein
MDAAKWNQHNAGPFLAGKHKSLRRRISGRTAPAVIVDRSSKETLGSFGRPDAKWACFTALHNIAVDRQGNIFTSEVNTGQRVQKFRRIDMQD